MDPDRRSQTRPEPRRRPRRARGANVAPGEVERLDGDAVHRVVRTALRDGQATVLSEELLRLGESVPLRARAGRRGRRRRSDGDARSVRGARRGARGAPQPHGLADIVRELRDTLALEADADIGAESTTANTGDGDESTQPPSQTAGRSRWSGRSDTDANEYPWADRTAVMGILNVTPTAFTTAASTTPSRMPSLEPKR